jgi:uncharacterized membrane protein
MSQTSPPEWQRNLILRIQRFIFWLSKHWLALANLFIFIYVAIPVAAPVLMNAGYTRPAQAIYNIYQPLCHELAFRSWFLFGEQIVYPRAEYEARFGLEDAGWPELFAHARSFIGNDTLGYKIAFCQRDIAIYVALLLGGLAFAYLRRRGLSAMPLWLFILVGVIPMGIDGGTQFISLFLPWFPDRESVWQLRVLTGALFGFSIAWLAYPYIQEGMDETKVILQSRYGWDGAPKRIKREKKTKREEVEQLLKDHDVI